jgi:murein DD-endopeptidase MepM/ murein hydrolase activator NlpD
MIIIKTIKAKTLIIIALTILAVAVIGIAAITQPWNRNKIECCGIDFGKFAYDIDVAWSDQYIKWVDFTPTYTVLKKTLDLDVKSRTSDSDIKLDWIELLAYLGAKYGGEYSRYNESDLNVLVKKLNDGQSIKELTADMKYYDYYHEAYTAVLAEFVGYYRVEVPLEDGTTEWRERYGLKVFSPIAKGYYYSSYDDFGQGRSYGYRRRHLGHDLMGSVGTPIIAIESGIVEELGWNQYGGWRIGIRSFDTKRYYYYAHLRKNRPYHADMKIGAKVQAGDVIGYMGRTGYSVEENVNNIKHSHLHLGLQLIFDESQKEGNNEIWIDVYPITKLLLSNKSAVAKDENKEYNRLYDFEDRG